MSIYPKNDKKIKNISRVMPKNTNKAKKEQILIWQQISILNQIRPA